MKIKLFPCAAILALICMSGCNNTDFYGKMNRQAAAESLIPVRPASEGRNPCWNKFAKKFMYAPAFDVPAMENAAKYRFTVRGDEGEWSFVTADPGASLAPIWNSIPPSEVELQVEALASDGSSLGVAYERKFLRDFPFEGPYRAPARDYREAAVKGALYIHMMPEIQNWIGSEVPDMAYSHNTYPCKIIGATIRNECLIARELPERRENALEVAQSAAAFLVRMSRPEGDPLAFFPPTYYLDKEASKREWNQGKTMTLEAASAGQAFLDLYDVTGEKEWLDRAVNIGRTYMKLQREDGSLPIKVDFVTGEPVNEVCAMLHPLLRYFVRLEGYGFGEFVPARLKGEEWMNTVAVERFDMTGQFEDVNVKGLEPYQNLTNCTAAPYASYLLRKKDMSDADLRNAIDLIRLSEDQFVHWAYPDRTQDGFPKKNAPCVHEQYHYEMPVDNSSCNVANAWLDLYEVTGDRLALAKAKALIDNITIQQNAVNGKIPTTFEWRDAAKDRKRTFWINCAFGSVTTLLRFAEME
jgi:maltose/maltodextrin transport system substrate-binding protein